MTQPPPSDPRRELSPASLRDRHPRPSATPPTPMAAIPPRSVPPRSPGRPTPHWSELNWLQRGVVLLEALMVSGSSSGSAARSPRRSEAPAEKRPERRPEKRSEARPSVPTPQTPPPPVLPKPTKVTAPPPLSDIPSDPQPAGSHLVQRRSGPPLPVQILRTSIVGVGLGAIVGTIMLAFDPSLRQPAASSGVAVDRVAQATAARLGTTQNGGNGASNTNAVNAVPESPLKRRSDALQNKLQALVTKRAGNVSPRIAVVDLDTGDFASWNDTQASIAASVIKIPILVAFFQEVDAGRIRLDEQLVMKKELVAAEAGVMQYRPVGTKFSALETVTQMIIISDNTATNMAIDRLGGAAKLNQRFREWGLEHTVIQNLLPDLAGTNTTSARDMAVLMGLLHRGELVSLRSRDRLLNILQNTKGRSLLPRPLGPDAIIAHKTGTLAKLLGDAGMVDLPNGRRYAIATLMHRPPNDGRAGDLIRETSALTYRHFVSLTPFPR
ncbi:MAG: class A beta-lactamase-related serine hydrolase [Cyanobacteria bacterium]|nr:class A beta-lactamase-related serine hydrolase [Cyanobacteriota bacterium]